MSNFSFRNPNETVGQEIIQEQLVVRQPTTFTTKHDPELKAWVEDVRKNIETAVADFKAAQSPEEMDAIIRAFNDYKIKQLGNFPGDLADKNSKHYYLQAEREFSNGRRKMRMPVEKTGMGIAGVVGLLGVAAGAYFIFK